jgi:LmbE family N-acetylglucosaminyl deacetylase
LEPLVTDKTLVFLAHPDDETMIAGTMWRLLEAGADVHAVWANTGEHPGPRQQMRWSETRAAMRALGMEESRIHFLDLPFLGMLDKLSEASDRLAALLDRLQPAQVLAVGFEGGHIDHDAVNFIAHEAIRRRGTPLPLYEFPLYNGAGSWRTFWLRANQFCNDETPPFYVPMTEASLRHKYAVMACYPSQARFMNAFRAIAKLRHFEDMGEPCRRVPTNRDYTEPPHAGKLNIERFFNRYMQVTFNDFAAAVRAARQVPQSEPKNLRSLKV